jgi:polar amino acid transport system substrate-binding protein
MAATIVTGCNKSENVIAGIDDAKNARIGVMSGTTAEITALKRFPKARIKSFDDNLDAVTALKSGQLGAVIMAFTYGNLVMKKTTGLQQLPGSLYDENLAIAVKKENVELLTAVNRIIVELKNNGTLESMKKRWFRSDSTPYTVMDIPVSNVGMALKIGVSAATEPFSFIDKEGRVTGHDSELARIIGAKLNRPVEFLNMKFMALIPALQSGKVDMIITGMTATDERRKAVNFSETYFVDSQVMLVKKSVGAINNHAKLVSVDDLKNKRIGVLLGSVHDTYVMKHYPDASILQYKSLPDVLLAVKSGKVDAGIYSREELNGILRNDNELGILGNSLFSAPIGFGFNKDDTSLREKCNEFLRQTKQNGVHKDMVERWINNGDMRMPTIANVKSNGVLVVGIVSNIGMPFIIVKDNKLVGFDIELIERFGAYLGKEVKFVDMEFGSLIAAATTNKIDMIASPLMITKERKKRISFSDVYYETGANIFALKKNIATTDTATESKSASLPFLQSVANSFQSNIIQENRYLLIWDGLKTTIIISVMAAIFGTLMGALVCFMRMSKNALFNIPAKVFISILRGTPVLVLLMLIFYVVFASVDISPVIVAVIAFGMNFAAYSAEIFRTGIEGVEKGQSEAGISLGFTQVTTFLNIVLPQTVRRILPIYKGEFISLVKMTSIVGYIAVQDLTKASDIIRSRTFDAFFPLVMVAILYFFISLFLMQSLEYLERRTDPKLKRIKAANS